MSAQPAHIGPRDTFALITLDGVNTVASWSVFSCNAESLRCPAGEIIVLRVAGQIDLYTLPRLQLALDGSLKRRPAHLVVDLTGTTFCSIQGLARLTQTGHTAADQATGYAVSGVPPHLDRVWTLGWDGEVPVRHRSIVVAVSAIRAAG